MNLSFFGAKPVTSPEQIELLLIRVAELEAAIAEHERDNAYVTNEDAVLYAALKGDG